MPNTFAGYRLVDPVEVRSNRTRFMRQPIDCLKYSNSLCVPSHRWPARGFFLLRQTDYAKINRFSTSLSLVIQDYNLAGSAKLTLQNLVIVQAQCVSTGITSDSDSVYLIEVTDKRGAVANKWFKQPTTSQYNVRSPAYPEQFYSDSLNGVTPWTWNEMIGDLWVQMPPYMGTYPGLPITPTGTPENFQFPGVSCWDAICSVLDLLGCVISVDLTSATPYGIARLGAGAAPAILGTAPTQDDYLWIDGGAGRIPGSVVVFFHRRNQYYGTEETVRRDSLQWQTDAFYSVPVVAPAGFSGGTGQHYLWDDLTVRYDVDGNPMAADVATANTIATERVAQYYAEIFRGTGGFFTRVFAGCQNIPTGAWVDGVCWTMDRERRHGWQTIAVRGPQPPFPEVIGGYPQID